MVLSFIATQFNGDKPAALPWRSAWMPGATFVGSMLFTNLALGFVSYPTQALAKSSKMIPVMLGGMYTLLTLVKESLFSPSKGYCLARRNIPSFNTCK